MPANWDQEVRLARVALQTEVLAELGDHLTTTNNNNGNSNGGGGNGNSNSNVVSQGQNQGLFQGQNLGMFQGQGQNQGQTSSSSGSDHPPHGEIALGKGLMKPFSPSERAAARKRAGIGMGIGVGVGGKNNRKRMDRMLGLDAQGKKKRKQTADGEEGSSSSLLLASSSSSTTTTTNPTSNLEATADRRTDGSSSWGTSKGGTTNGLVYAGGLTLDQAQGLEGVAKVGHDQPAWKER